MVLWGRNFLTREDGYAFSERDKLVSSPYEIVRSVDWLLNKKDNLERVLRFVDEEL